jgi:hypothetical protein
MMKKLMHDTVTAAGFAALLLAGACASHNAATASATDGTDDVVQVTQSGAVVPAPGPAKVDSDGNIYSSSAAPGSGNAASVGTNTNVNVVPDRSTVAVNGSTVTVQDTPMDLTTSNTATLDTEVDTNAADTTTQMQSTTVTTPAPMISSSTVETQSTTSTTNDTTATTTTETRQRMRKD